MYSKKTLIPYSIKVINLSRVTTRMPIVPRIPAGVMELLSPQQIALTRMLDTVRRGFERFGFLPVETPASRSKTYASNPAALPTNPYPHA
jgi:hypothetical protein